MPTKYRTALPTVMLATVVAMTLSTLSTNAFAHGGEQHVMGTVTQLDAASITVKTTTGEVKTVMILADTKFAKGTSTITPRELKVGDRVVIHAKLAGTALQATEVRIGAVARPASHPQ